MTPAPFEQVKAAWEAADRRAALNRTVEDMAAEGVSLDALDDALWRLLGEVRAAGADDDTEEIINEVCDRLHGWCHEKWHIKTKPVADTNGHLPGASVPSTPSPTPAD